MNYIKVFRNSVLALAVIIFVMLSWDFGSNPDSSFAASITRCQILENRSAVIECYNDLARRSLEEKPPSALLEEFSMAMMTSSEVRRDCHQVSHAIGRATYDALGDIVNVFSLDREIDSCGGGFFHGAIEKMFHAGGEYAEHIAPKELKEKTPTICSVFRGEQERRCIHGVGHGAMYLTGVIKDALSLCEFFPDKSLHFGCFSGVFMEYNISSAGTEDEAKDLQFPCNMFEDPYRLPCYYVHSFKFAALDLSREEVVEACNRAPQPVERARCVRGYSIFFLAHDALAEGFDSVVTFCETLGEIDSKVCTEGTAARLASLTENGENALPFCTRFDKKTSRMICFSYVARVLQIEYGKKRDAMEEECQRYLGRRYQDECLASLT